MSTPQPPRRPWAPVVAFVVAVAGVWLFWLSAMVSALVRG